MTTSVRSTIPEMMTMVRTVAGVASASSPRARRWKFPWRGRFPRSGTWSCRFGGGSDGDSGSERGQGGLMCLRLWAR